MISDLIKAFNEVYGEQLGSIAPDTNEEDISTNSGTRLSLFRSTQDNLLVVPHPSTPHPKLGDLEFILMRESPSVKCLYLLPSPTESANFSKLILQVFEQNLMFVD